MPLPRHFQLRTLLVLMLIAFLATVAMVEQFRSSRLQSQLTGQQTMTSAIRHQLWEIKKRELALEYSRNSLAKDQVAFIQSGGTVPVGIRRELANIRNAELKLSREKDKLQSMLEQWLPIPSKVQSGN